jgi:hypothetical protein
MSGSPRAGITGSGPRLRRRMVCLLGLDRLGFPRCFDFARASSLSLRCLSGYRDCTGGRRGLKDRARGHGRRSGRAALAAKKIHDPHLEPVSWRSEFEVPYCFDVKFRTPRPVGPDRLEEVFEAAPFKRPLRFYRPDGMNRHDGWLAVESCGYSDFAEAQATCARFQEALLIVAAKQSWAWSSIYADRSKPSTEVSSNYRIQACDGRRP